ncbi:MAG: 16S rRNA (adenine(1518)-N(6)/adenine(1519)-N(6))-dimethyltransferase RsmA [Candidatus Nealsonbacteria bacterium]
MNSLKDNIRLLLKKHNIQPSKGLGQNFLIDGSAINKVVSAIDFKSDNTIIEVGPGFGILTKRLVEKAKKVVAIEKDPNMVKLLEEESSLSNNLEIINSDILKWEPEEANYTLVGNIPFYLTAPVIRKFLEYKNKPKQIVFIIQKEVAQRICANPPKMSILAVSVQLYAEAKIISYIKKDSFWPSPKIDSAIIKIVPKKEKLKVDTDLFFKVVKAGFSQPRKQLLNNLSTKLNVDKIKILSWLSKNNIKPELRAETLEVKDWINLTKSFKID